MKIKSNHTSRNPKPIACSCKSEYQDGLYGVGTRLHNPAAHATAHNWRCTVCGKERTGEAKADAKAEEAKKG